jgi:hypothetical protein
MSDTAATFTEYLEAALNQHVKEHGNEIDLVVRQNETELVWVDAADKKLWLITVQDAQAEVVSG